jgi:Mg/Co/Ni transporter MgtE
MFQEEKNSSFAFPHERELTARAMESGEQGRASIRELHIKALPPISEGEKIGSAEPQEGDDPTSALSLVEAARLFEIMGNKKAPSVLRSMPPQSAANVLDHTHPSYAIHWLQDMTWQEAARTLDYTNPQVAVQLLQNLNLRIAVRLLEQMNPQAAGEVLGVLDRAAIALVFDEMSVKAIVRIFDHASAQIAATLLIYLPLRRALYILEHIRPQAAGKIIGNLEPQSGVALLDRLQNKIVINILDHTPAHMAACLLKCMPLSTARDLVKRIRPETAGKIMATPHPDVAALILETLPPKTTANLIADLIEKPEEEDAEEVPAEIKKADTKPWWQDVVMQLMVGYIIGGLNNIFPSLLAHHWLWGPFLTGGIASTLANYALKRWPYPMNAFAQTIIGQTVTLGSYFISSISNNSSNTSSTLKDPRKNS